MLKFIIAIFLISFRLTYSQDTVKIVTWNILEYTGTDTTVRNPFFRSAINGMNPDILVIQEVYTQQVVNNFLTGVMNASGIGTFTAGTFISGPGSDNAIYFRPEKFAFIANNPIRTTQRDINEFVVRHNLSGDTLRLFTVHLISGTGAANEQIRAAEIDSLRKVTNLLPAGTNFIVLGDFNLTGAIEQAYLKLIQPGGIDGRFFDALNLPGIWDNPAYAPYHTQSARVRAFGGGATGGLDDRFDIIMFSNSVFNSGNLRYVSQTLTAYGNDGNHYNDSVNRLPNNSVGQTIANALHYSSDHLPVTALFSFGGVVSVGNNSNLMSEFILRQNFPNPFNPVTKISFEIDDVLYGRVILKIHNSLGKEIETLLDKELRQGKYEIDWDAKNFSSGIYFYRILIYKDKLSTYDFSETGKMVLLK